MILEGSNVDGRQDGRFKLTFRYALGRNETRTAILIVNGDEQEIDFESTGSWDNWQTGHVRKTLNRGRTNTIRVETIRMDAGNLSHLASNARASAQTL